MLKRVLNEKLGYQKAIHILRVELITLRGKITIDVLGKKDDFDRKKHTRRLKLYMLR